MAHGDKGLRACLERRVSASFVALDDVRIRRVAKQVLPHDLDGVPLDSVAGDPFSIWVVLAAVVREIEAQHSFLRNSIHYKAVGIEEKLRIRGSGVPW